MPDDHGDIILMARRYPALWEPGKEGEGREVRAGKGIHAAVMQLTASPEAHFRP